jgi:hypothetical protein
LETALTVIPGDHHVHVLLFAFAGVGLAAEHEVTLGIEEELYWVGAPDDDIGVIRFLGIGRHS